MLVDDVGLDADSVRSIYLSTRLILSETVVCDLGQVDHPDDTLCSGLSSHVELLCGWNYNRPINKAGQRHNPSSALSNPTRYPIHAQSH